MKMRSFFIVFAGVAALPLAAPAADWPQWRGPHRDGVSQETGLLPEWPKDGPKLAWQSKEVGEGYSTPAVVGDRIYLLGNKGMDDEFVEALDAKDGEPGLVQTRRQSRGRTSASTTPAPARRRRWTATCCTRSAPTATWPV